METVKKTRNKKGELHSYNDEPALITEKCKIWYKNGLKHRDGDKPAMVFDDGTNVWFKNGLQHRDNDKPAVVYFTGTSEWWFNDKFHRKNGPALIEPGFCVSYFQNNKPHRTDGPAIELINGVKLWFIDGVGLEEAEHKLVMEAKNNDNIVINNKKYKVIR